MDLLGNWEVSLCFSVLEEPVPSYSSGVILLVFLQLINVASLGACLSDRGTSWGLQCVNPSIRTLRFCGEYMKSVKNPQINKPVPVLNKVKLYLSFSCL